DGRAGWGIANFCAPANTANESLASPLRKVKIDYKGKPPVGRMRWRPTPGTDKSGREPLRRKFTRPPGFCPRRSRLRSDRSMALLNRLKWVSAGLAFAGV